MNRDYFTRPIQHSRSTHDYGHSGTIEPMRASRSKWTLDYVLTAATIFLGTLALVAYWPS